MFKKIRLRVAARRRERLRLKQLEAIAHNPGAVTPVERWSNPT